MRIWVDADACPKVIKEILFRVANRTQIPVIFVANQLISTPSSPYISKIVVTSGFDVADNRIVKSLQPRDIVITADIPLADAVVNNGCTAINPRGELYSPANIKERLSIRNFNDALRGSGVPTGGPSTFSQKEIRQFSNTLDRILGKKSS